MNMQMDATEKGIFLRVLEISLILIALFLFEESASIAVPVTSLRGQGLWSIGSLRHEVPQVQREL
jgi:hypothetical protein